MGDFEVCSNGAAEISAQPAVPAVTSPSNVNQSEAGSSPEQAASDTEEGTGGPDSCSTDDDQFSDVGEAADTEVVTDRRLHSLPTALLCQLIPPAASTSMLDCIIVSNSFAT